MYPHIRNPGYENRHSRVAAISIRSAISQTLRLEQRLLSAGRRTCDVMATMRTNVANVVARPVVSLVFSLLRRRQHASQCVTDSTEPRSIVIAIARGRFTDKGTPGVILGRKAKAFEILDFRLPILD